MLNLKLSTRGNYSEKTTGSEPEKKWPDPDSDLSYFAFRSQRWLNSSEDPDLQLLLSCTSPFRIRIQIFVQWVKSESKKCWIQNRIFSADSDPDPNFSTVSDPAPNFPRTATLYAGIQGGNDLYGEKILCMSTGKSNLETTHWATELKKIIYF